MQSEETLGSLDLGWYWSENKEEFQMAKIAEEDRTTHFYVIGATGTGKTKFLEYLIQQDVNKENGFGVIDPHGDLIEDIKGYIALQYADRRKIISDRIVLIDPTDPALALLQGSIQKTWQPSEVCPSANLIGCVGLNGLRLNGVYVNFAQ